MDKIVLKIVKDIAPDEIEKITTITGFIVLIVKIIEKAQKKKNLSYEDSKKLVDLIVVILFETLEGRNISRDLREVLDFIRDHRPVFNELVDDSILVWDLIVPKLIICCRPSKRKVLKIEK